MDGSRILVVEDEPILREFLTLIVEDTGANASAVETADQGIALLDKKPWAAVITDVRTPGQADGWDLAWAVHDRWPDLYWSLPVAVIICLIALYPRVLCSSKSHGPPSS